MRRLTYLSLTICALLLAACTTVITPEAATTEAPTSNVSDVELLGMITVPNDTVVFDTPVGGLSAMAYNIEDDTYYFLTDDRATLGPVRIYQAQIDLSDGTLDEGDLTWTGLIPLLDESGAPFAQGALDPEGLVYTGDNFYLSTEGDVATHPPIAPAIIEFTRTGEFVASLHLPDKFIPTDGGNIGVRNNKGFESLTLTPDGRTLISGVENALVQDGPTATLEDESPARLLTIELGTGDFGAEQIYLVDDIPIAPTPKNGDADNGLAELIALDNTGALLALERSYAQGVGNTVRLYIANTQGSADVSQEDSLTAGDSGYQMDVDLTVRKELLVDFGELGSTMGVAPDNLEGMALGPQLPNGRQVLLMVSDNNFNPSQTTQIWALALTLESVPTK